MQGRIDDSRRQKHIKLDVKDKRILVALAQNSRMPLTQLRKSVQLSRDAVNYRIERLEKNGVIEQFVPIIDLKQFGYYVFHVFFLLDERESQRCKAFFAALEQLPYVKDIIEYSDQWDVEVVMIAKDIHDFDEKLNEITHQFHDVIHEKEKLKVVKGYHSIHVPYDFYQEAGVPIVPYTIHHQHYQADTIDITLLKALSVDARTSYYDLGKLVGMTSEAVSYRLKKMEAADVIRKYSLIVNLSALGYHWFTFVMQTKMFTPAHEQKMLQFVSVHPHIIRAVKTLGRWDFLFYMIAKDPKAFHQSIKGIKRQFNDILRKHDAFLGYRERVFRVMPGIISQ